MQVPELTALEVLDSRGRPTVQVSLAPAGVVGIAGVPSGASKGTREAVERRDGGDRGDRRYGGLGVLGAVSGIGDAALLKVNQAGTVTETVEAADAARRTGYGAMVSHRAGETTDSFIADLAVALGCGQSKSGAPAQGERVAMCNRLLVIAAAQPGLPYGLRDEAPRWRH